MGSRRAKIAALLAKRVGPENTRPDPISLCSDAGYFSPARRGASLWALSSEIRGDTLVLPVAVTRRFRTFRAVIFLGRGFAIRRGRLPARFGLGERAFCRGRQRLSCWGRGRSRPVKDRRSSSIYSLLQLIG